MYSSCLSLIQSFCREYALPSPGSIKGQNDAGAFQLRELLQATGEYAWERGQWEQTLRRVVFSGTGVQSLGAIATLPRAAD